MDSENSTIVTIDGKHYTLVLDLKVMMDAEKRFSTPQRYVTFVEGLNLISRGSPVYLAHLVCAMFSRKHPELTHDEVYTLAQKYGGIFKLKETIEELANNLIADPKDLEELGVSASNPLDAQARKKTVGTGAH